MSFADRAVAMGLVDDVANALSPFLTLLRIALPRGLCVDLEELAAMGWQPT